MTDDIVPLDDLLSRMPEIAKAVSAFPEAVQQSAFDALMGAASGAVPATSRPPDRGADETDSKKQPLKKRRTRNPGTDTGNGKSRRVASAQPKLVRELDLRPKGKTSFVEFVAEKNPASNHDKAAVAIYYLANIAGLAPVTLDDVYTAWREMGWKLPFNFANSLQLTASKKRFVDTKDSGDLRLLNPGLNRVEQDLPLKPKKS